MQTHSPTSSHHDNGKQCPGGGGDCVPQYEGVGGMVLARGGTWWRGSRHLDATLGKGVAAQKAPYGQPEEPGIPKVHVCTQPVQQQP